jgi:hypothetical protein
MISNKHLVGQWARVKGIDVAVASRIVDKAIPFAGTKRTGAGIAVEAIYGEMVRRRMRLAPVSESIYGWPEVQPEA